MKQAIQQTLALTAIGAACLGLSVGAMGAPSVSHSKPNVAPMQKICHCPYKQGKRMHKGHHGPWNLGLHKKNKRLTQEDAKTITKAALLMKGKRNLQVGQITTKVSKRGTKFYLIKIINKKNKVVRTVVLNSKNGRIRPIMRHLNPAMQKLTPAKKTHY